MNAVWTRAIQHEIDETDDDTALRLDEGLVQQSSGYRIEADKRSRWLLAEIPGVVRRSGVYTPPE